MFEPTDKLDKMQARLKKRGLTQTVPKTWGEELIFVSNDLYCGKILVFKEKASLSLHTHLEKRETFYCKSGKFALVGVDAKTSERYSFDLNPGDVVDILPGQFHKLLVIDPGEIIEVSTKDDPRDNIRIEASQSK